MARLLTAPIKVLDNSDMTVITHRVIFARLYGLLKPHVVQNHPTVITQLPLSTSIFAYRLFPSKRKHKQSGKRLLKSFNSFLFLYVEEHRTRFVDSRESDTIKLIHNAAPERTKKSINLLLTCDTEGQFNKRLERG